MSVKTILEMSVDSCTTLTILNTGRKQSLLGVPRHLELTVNFPTKDNPCRNSDSGNSSDPLHAVVP